MENGTSGDSVVLNKPDGYDAAFLKDYNSFFDPKDRVEPPPDPIEVHATACVIAAVLVIQKAAQGKNSGKGGRFGGPSP
jgi:hypothetical protein